MNYKPIATSVATLVFAAGIAVAQEQSESSETSPSITYEDLPNGTLYFKETFSDWRLRCQKDIEAKDKCQLFQLLKSEHGNTVARITVFDFQDTEGLAVAGANITVPLETALREGLKMRIDENSAKGYPFTYCDDEGCHARIGFTAVELKWLQDGSKALLRTVPYTGERQPVDVEISLSGFTAGYKAVVENNTP